MAKKENLVENTEPVIETIESATEPTMPSTELVLLENNNEPQALEDLTVKELLDLSEAAKILGKHFENLAFAEGNAYFPQKSKYNTLYNDIIMVLSNKLETFIK